MRGFIKRRGKSKDKWSVVIELGKDPITNKRRQKWYTVEGTKKEAEKFLTEKQNSSVFPEVLTFLNIHFDADLENRFRFGY